MKRTLLLALLAAAICPVLGGCCDSAPTSPRLVYSSSKGPTVSHSIISPRDPQSGLPSGQGAVTIPSRKGD